MARRKKDAFLAGSYTVEAAFLVPIIIGIFFAWLFQLFYLHDEIVMNGMLKEAVIEREENAHSGEKGDSTEWEDRQKGKEIQSHLWMMKIQSFQWRKEVIGGKYMLRSKVEWDIPIMKRFIKSYFAYCVSVESTNLRPEQSVRLTGKEG